MSSWNINFDRDYHDAVQHFRDTRADYTRVAFCQREFVLASGVTECLEKPLQGSPYRNNLDKLRITSYHRQRKRLLPVTEKELGDYLRVFYALLDLDYPHLVHLFREHRLNDSRLPLSPEEVRPCLPPELVEPFCERQYDWCPLHFELNMGERCESRIIPAYRRKRIEPRQDSHRSMHSATTLWEVELPEELIGENLRKTVPNAAFAERDGEDPDDTNDMNPGKRWKFAFKTFADANKRQFLLEKEAFRLLDHRPGMIQYVGWFQHRELEQEYHTIVLEYADSDLYSLLKEKAPPVFPSEIEGFWYGMLDVSRALDSIHNDLIQNNIPFDLWHGDIKPENILRVGEQFKLADPGEARYQVSTSRERVARTQVPGGTRTYAAPELSDSNAATRTPLTQNTDVWSLGCVLSEAATFVVAGSQGIFQYERVRRIAIDQCCQAQGDAFHDNREVLPVVRDWHSYLRSAVRHTDAFTVAILDLVDEHMLVSPARKRWDARSVCMALQKIMNEPCAEFKAVPASIEQLLEEIDVDEEMRHERSLGIKRVDSDQITKGRPGHSATDQPSSGDKRILPTVQRTRHRQAKNSSAVARNAPESVVDLTGLSRPRTARDLTVMTSKAFGYDASGRSLAAWNMASLDQRAPVMHIWAVERELIEKRKKRDLRGLISSGTAKILTIRRRWGGKSDRQSKQPEYDPLDNFLYKRDIIYLVDNGSSMYHLWLQVCHWAKVLVWRSLGYDDDGMEMYFTNPGSPPTEVRQTRQQKVEDFAEAMERAKPQAPPGPDGVKTIIQTSLDAIINDYIASMAAPAGMPRKMKTIVVLTDGVWEGMTTDNSVDKYIKTKLETLMESKYYSAKAKRGLPADAGPYETRAEIVRILEEERPITIQFVRFGHSFVGMNRLRRLDDDPRREGYPDLIDTEPADGDVYKMFLGPLSSERDQQTTYADEAPSTSRTASSVHETEPAGGTPSRADTFGSDARSSTSPSYVLSQPDQLADIGTQFNQDAAVAGPSRRPYRAGSPQSPTYRGGDGLGGPRRPAPRPQTGVEPGIYGGASQPQRSSGLTLSAQRPEGAGDGLPFRRRLRDPS